MIWGKAQRILEDKLEELEAANGRLELEKSSLRSDLFKIREDQTGDDLLGRKLLINLKSGGAIRGVLVRRRGVRYYLENAEFIPENDPHRTSKPFTAVVERPNIAFYQVIS